jgi:putative flippase GtrA
VHFKQFIVTAGTQFLKFGIVGLSNTAIFYAIYSLLVYINLHYLLASSIAFVVGVLNSFYWNSRYVFKNPERKRNILKSLLRIFLAAFFTGFILQNTLLYVLISLVGISKYVAPLFCLIVTVPLNFILNKFWVFRN